MRYSNRNSQFQVPYIKRKKSKFLPNSVTMRLDFLGRVVDAVSKFFSLSKLIRLPDAGQWMTSKDHIVGPNSSQKTMDYWSMIQEYRQN